jgi:hypothetical protein
MKGTIGLALGVFMFLTASYVFAQNKQVRHEHAPAASEAGSTSSPVAPDRRYRSILDGLPKGFELHHDTEVGTGKPIDVYLFPIEMQVLNSDGDLEPEGLIKDNFFTAQPVDPITAVNPHSARDCKIWNGLVLAQVYNRDPTSRTWPYVEFTVAQFARTVQTNEDGTVWWSDDVECWGSQDRFPPF